MFELKRISPKGIDVAFEKAERYRLLNEPWQAESICRDILEIEPDNQEALIILLLAITDQFKSDGEGRVSDAKAVLERLEGEYVRAYYEGIIWERRGTALIHRRAPGRGTVAYERLLKAMECYERAEAVGGEEVDSAIIRWNSCARVIERYEHIHPEHEVKDLRPALE